MKTLTSPASLAARLSLLALPVVLMGAENQCDPPPVCPEIALDCAEGYAPADTDGDGCDDSCVPDVVCEAYPSCEEGDFEVSDPSACLQDDAACYEVSLCGTTITCTGPRAPASCYDDSECAEGQRCDTENYCDAPTDCGEGLDCLAVCYGRCVNDVVCPAIAIDCAPGFYPADTDGDGCEDGCVPEAVCDAYPSCDEGDFEVEGPAGCLQDDAACYEVTLCGTTITCTGPREPVVSCYDDSECGEGQRCDTENHCDSATDCGEGQDCLAVCYGRCVDEDEPAPACPAIYLDCGEHGEPVDTDGDGCVDACLELFP